MKTTNPNIAIIYFDDPDEDLYDAASPDHLSLFVCDERRSYVLVGGSYE